LPIYAYRCPQHSFEIFSSIKDHVSKPSCPECGKESQQVFSAPRFSIDYTDREDFFPSLGEHYFSNKQKLRDHLQKNGLEEVGSPEMREQVERRMRAAREKKADTGSLE
jgi:putative FmdB family regulatory protein